MLTRAEKLITYFLWQTANFDFLSNASRVSCSQWNCKPVKREKDTEKQRKNGLKRAVCVCFLHIFHNFPMNFSIYVP